MRNRHGLRLGVAALGLVLTAVGLEATEAPAGFSIDDATRLRHVAEAEVSPVGPAVAYVLNVPRVPYEEPDGPAWTELHVVDRETGIAREFVGGQVNVSTVRWRPDGDAISFLAKRSEEEKKALYVIALGGGESRKVVTLEEDISAYSWSPDGSRIALLAKEVLSVEQQKLTEKGFTAEVYEESLRPVRVWVAQVGSSDTAATPRMLELDGSASEIHWSPQGDRIAVALAPTPLIDDEYMKRQVRIVEVETGSVTGRIETVGKIGAVRWSPDGERIGLIGSADIHDPKEGRLMVAAATGGGVTDLVPELMGHVVAFAFRDPDTIVFIAQVGVDSVLSEVGVETGERRLLVGPGGPIMGSLSLSADGTDVVLTADSPRHPAEVFRLNPEAGRIERLTRSNPWLEDVRLAEQEVVSYSARDGLTIEALLIRPLDTKAGERVPLIVVVHGGPESHYSNGWLTGYSTPGQIAAAAGYAVLYPNYRGSTGRGVEFSKLDQADYAEEEFNDLVDGVKYLVDRGLVDEDRVGVTGGSYGGFASAWCATALTEHFAAAVMFVGISEQISKFGTTDIPNEMFLVHARRWPWDYWDWFRERSPVYYVEQARTPILILHGKEDPRVHPSQSMILYRYLKTLGKVPVRLVLYPGEKHGNTKAAARLDYSRRLMRWMDHYLKGPGGDPPAPELEHDVDKLGLIDAASQSD